MHTCKVKFPVLRNFLKVAFPAGKGRKKKKKEEETLLGVFKKKTAEPAA